MTGWRAFTKLNASGDAFRQGIQEVLDLTNTEGTAERQCSILGIATTDRDLEDSSAVSRVYQSGGLHRYMVQHGYWLTRGMAGVLCTLIDSADVDPFCETLKEGILNLKGRVR